LCTHNIPLFSDPPGRAGQITSLSRGTETILLSVEVSPLFYSPGREEFVEERDGEEYFLQDIEKELGDRRALFTVRF
jgi:hypothetical protein